MLSIRLSVIFSAVLAGAVFAITQTYSFANNHLNCQAYAQSVISQVSENNKWGCGFSGPQWSPDFNFHFNWCNQATTQIHHLGEQENFRKSALQQCKITKPGSGVRPANAYNEAGCDSYAKQMISNAKINVTRSCGINDPRMHQNYQAHFDWCFNGRTKQQVRATLNEVIRSIQQCGEDKAAIETFNTPMVTPTTQAVRIGNCFDQASQYCDGRLSAQKYCEYRGYRNLKSYKISASKHMTYKMECMLGAKRSPKCACQTATAGGQCKFLSQVTCQGKINKP